MRANIVLTGFMGTGKSTVGPALAAALGRPFVDLDALIVARAGCDIPTIFAQSGEVGFRQHEAAVLAEIGAQAGLVVATGGGALVGAGNRAHLAGKATVICLTATPEVLAARLGGATDRPLLQEADWQGRLQEILAHRAFAYSQIPNQVDTSHKSVPQVVEALLACLERAQPLPAVSPETLTIPVTAPGGDYPILFGSVAGLGALLHERGLAGPVAIVTNTTVGLLHGYPLQADLAAAGIPSILVTVPDGEQHKNLTTTEVIYTKLLEQGVDRAWTVVALGGGVIGDMAGFVAATYMRGLPFVQVPTSLLAMVDASVGGKVAVDHPQAKNLIGAFKQPAAVLIDQGFLATLPPRELRNGLAEVIKHGILADPALFEMIAAQPPSSIQADFFTPQLLAQAVQVKVDVVGRDPYERGERATLNLGHTFGHAYELLSGFALGHGEAIAIGMVTAARLSETLGMAAVGVAAQIEATIARVGLPTTWPEAPDPQRIWQTMQGDKKKTPAGLRLILPLAIGHVVITPPGSVPQTAILDALAGVRQ